MCHKTFDTETFVVDLPIRIQTVDCSYMGHVKS